MKRISILFLLSLLFAAGLQAVAGDVRVSNRKQLFEIYPQTASALPLRRIRGAFARGRNRVFGVNGSPQNFASALVYLRYAAARHYAPAQTLMGLMYAKGYGLPENHATARQWYQLAARQGYARALIKLGDWYAEEHVVSADAVQVYACYASAKSHSQIGTPAYRDAIRRIETLTVRMTAAQKAITHRLQGQYPSQCLKG